MRLVIVPAALTELQDAATFHTAQVNVDLAHALVNEFERVVNLIFSSPQFGAIFRGNRPCPLSELEHSSRVSPGGGARTTTGANLAIGARHRSEPAPHSVRVSPSAS